MGSVYTVVTQEGGNAVTLAESGFGRATTIAGSVYTVATAAASDAVDGDNDTDSASTLSWSAGAAVVGSVIVGAYITL